MDLKKLDPMARKMRSHVDEFYKALESQDGLTARTHINEIIKYADYMSKDIEATLSSQITQSVSMTSTQVEYQSRKCLKYKPFTLLLPMFYRGQSEPVIGNINRRLNNRTL